MDAAGDTCTIGFGNPVEIEAACPRVSASASRTISLLCLCCGGVVVFIVMIIIIIIHVTLRRKIDDDDCHAGWVACGLELWPLIGARVPVYRGASNHQHFPVLGALIAEMSNTIPHLHKHRTRPQ
jgi:hypothetical protein